MQNRSNINVSHNLILIGFQYYEKLVRNRPKHLLFLILFSFSTLVANSQNRVENFNGKMFVRVDTNWHLFENTGNNGSPKLTPIDGNVISAKLKPNLRNNTEAIRVAQDLNLSFLRLNIAGWADFYLPNSADYFDLANGLKNHVSISDVDINYFMTLANVNDPLATCTTGATSLSCQWAIANRGLQDTWDDFNYGNKVNTQGPIVAIFDTGLDITHPDIGPGTGANSHSNLWQNVPEVNGTPGIDDDNNNIVDDKYGAYFTGTGQFPGQVANEFITDDYFAAPSHGTHVSGIVAAKTNNGVGIAGVAGGNNLQGARIMTLKVFGPQVTNQTSSATLDDAIYYAVLNKAKILNFSLFTQPTQQLNNALNFAANAGCFLVAASGNVQDDEDERRAKNGVGWFPANHPRVFGVGNGGGSVLAGGQTFSVSITSFYGDHTDICAR
jgi:hypothetical protein